MGALGGEAEMKSLHLELISDLTADHEQRGGRAPVPAHGLQQHWSLI